MKPILPMRLVIAVVLTCFVIGNAHSDTINSDEDTIRTQIQRYLDAWNAGDAKALADLCDEDCDRINARSIVLSGKSGIYEHYKAVFATEPPDSVERRLVYKNINVRLISGDAAIVDAEYTVSGVGPQPASVISGRNAVVMVKRNGQWLRAAHRNWVPTTGDQLRRVPPDER